MKSCPDPTELARVKELPDSHPLRDHVRDCGRCRAALTAMRSFTEAQPDQPIAEHDLTDANRRLGAFIESELLGDEPAARPRARTAPTWPRRWMAAAALLIIAVGIWQIGPVLIDTGQDSGTRMRGEASIPASTLVPVVSTGEGGASQVMWDAVEGADDYLVILWNDALAEISRLDADPATHRVIEQPATWVSVVARQAGREIARSELVRLP